MNVLSDESAVRATLPWVARGLDKYIWIQSHVRMRDVSIDREFQRRFAGFYRVRRNATWRTSYFQLLEAAKAGGVTFHETLTQLADQSGRVEASFASKLVATLDDALPVIDSVVLKHVGLRLPAPATLERLKRIVQLFDDLSQWYAEQLSSPPGMSTVRLFREAYPAAQVSDLKALDLVLWQLRERH
jgi:hypothetical protein